MNNGLCIVCNFNEAVDWCFWCAPCLAKAKEIEEKYEEKHKYERDEKGVQND